jgi:tetratricopeptide (TPR) repeat protein
MSEETLRRRKAKIGSEDTGILTTMENLAGYYYGAGRLDQGLSLGEEALALRKINHGSEEPHTLTAINRLASRYEFARKYPEAIRLYQEALMIERYKLAADDLALADTLASLGLCLLHTGKPTESEPILRECLAIREKKKPDSWKTFNIKSLLGGSLLGQKRYADAEPLLLAGYKGMKQREDRIPEKDKSRLTESLERLVQLYDAWGKKDKADEWRKKLQEEKKAGKPAAKP